MSLSSWTTLGESCSLSEPQILHLDGTATLRMAPVFSLCIAFPHGTKTDSSTLQATYLFTHRDSLNDMDLESARPGSKSWIQIHYLFLVVWLYTSHLATMSCTFFLIKKYIYTHISRCQTLF